MASSGRTVEVDVRVEVVPGPATVAWLERLGWTRPSEPEDNAGLVVPEEKDLLPAYPTGMDTSGSVALRRRAAQRRSDLRHELTEAGQIKLDDLLRMYGADLTALPSVNCDC